MMRSPGFWRHNGVLPHLLAPLGRLTAALTARRVARPGWLAPVPVICVGNAGVGGAGKTTVALDLIARLPAQHPAFLTRGYGGTRIGRVTGPEFGDEPALLARAAPTYANPDRAAAARQALAEGADALVMDDGLQNPTLHKTLSLLVIDGAAGFGNARCLPAGPLREPPAAAAARCAAAILIGADAHGATRHLPAALPVLHARLVAENSPPGGPFLAFAGLARPEKFAETLRAAGVPLAGFRPFPDHHRYTASDLAALRAPGLPLLTTPKDSVKLPEGFAQIVRVRLEWAPESLAHLNKLLATAKCPPILLRPTANGQRPTANRLGHPQ